MIRKADLAGSLALAAVGVFGLVTGVRYGVGGVTQPGPGLMPALAGAALLVFALMTALREIVARGQPALAADDGEEAALAPDALARVIGYLVGIFGFALLMEPIGTLPTAALFFVWIVRGVERQSWRVTLALTAGVTLGVWLLFVKALKVSLPMGVF